MSAKEMETDFEKLCFARVYITSLKKELAEKDRKIGEQDSYIRELEAERTLAKGDLKQLKKDMKVKQISGMFHSCKGRVRELEKDVEKLIIKLHAKSNI